MLKRMRVTKPVVYEVVPEDRRVPEDEWGWMELGDISKIAGLPSFFILMHFLDFGSAPLQVRGRRTRIFYYRVTPCSGLEDFELRALDTRAFANVYEDCRCNGELHEDGLNRYVETHRVRVPARWGAQVLDELKKNPVQMPS